MLCAALILTADGKPEINMIAPILAARDPEAKLAVFTVLALTSLGAEKATGH